MANVISFITNTSKTHKEDLLKLFEEADEIIFAVGFLKKSGLNNIKTQLEKFCKKKGKKSTFYIGIGFGETNPDALQGLHNILKSKVNHKLVICTPDAGIFHPKTYVFIKENKAIVVTGSANMTEAGWVANDELSSLSEMTTLSPEFIGLSNYFNTLSKLYETEDIAGLIKRYKDQLLEYNENHEPLPTFRFKRKKTSIAGIDMPRLKGYYELYKKSDDFIEPKEREQEYQQAKENLEILSSRKRLDGEQFHSLFGPLVGHLGYKPKLWHSGSIHRKTYETLNYPDAFRDIVRSVKENISKPVPVAFDKAISLLLKMKKYKEIYGVGTNIVTEIFLSFRPKTFANLSDNPLTVLSLIGKEFPSVSSFKGDDYFEYVTLLARIKNELEMSSFLEIDSFLNYVYWNLIEE